VKPLRVRVRVGADSDMDLDYLAGHDNGAPDREEHWLVHVAVPFHGIQSLPGTWRRSSCWARSDRASYCDTMGRVIALYTLEALNQETGRMKRGEQLALGPDISRDKKYSESDGWWTAVRDDSDDWAPAIAAWVAIFVSLLIAIRLFVFKHRAPSVRSLTNGAR
jgi:hypothetical protein